MMPAHVINVCHQGPLKGQQMQRQVCLFEGISASEVSTVLGTLFRVPEHRRVVGLAGIIGLKDVFIPLSAACRYPGLVFPFEVREGGTVFRTVTKEADRPHEVLFPLSALTPPPSVGSNDLPEPQRTPRRKGPAEPAATITPSSFLRMGKSIPLSERELDTMVIPALVAGGSLSSEEGRSLTAMVRNEDPVVFAACRVAAFCSYSSAAGSADVSGMSIAEGSDDRNTLQLKNGDVVWNLVSMLRVVLRERRRNKTMAAYSICSRSDRGDSSRQGGATSQVDVGVRHARGIVDDVTATRRRRKGAVGNADIIDTVQGAGCAGATHGDWWSVDDCGNGCVDGWGFGNSEGKPCEVQQRGRETEEHSKQFLPDAPEAFQADVIALADVAFLMGRLSRAGYIQALYKGITLDKNLLLAYQADVRELLRRGVGGPPHATLRALGASDSSTSLSPSSPPLPRPSVDNPRWETEAEAPPISSALPQQEIAEISGRTPVGGVEEGSGVPEPVLRDIFLRRALALIAEGIDGLDEHDEGVVENAISSEHPWVSAIYDECKETGDVRGLMQNLRLLPALLKRDQTSSSIFATDRPQPPPPGEWETTMDPKQHGREHRQHHHVAPQLHLPNLPPQQQYPVQENERAWSRGLDPNGRDFLVRSLANSPVPGTPTQATSGVSVRAPLDRDGGSVKVRKGRGQASNGSHRNGDGDLNGGTEDVAHITQVAPLGVIEQLCRVISGCSHLLQLRGVIGEAEERVLSTMSRCGSPVLLAAVEAYGVNEDLEGLLDTITTAAKMELSRSQISGANTIGTGTSTSNGRNGAKPSSFFASSSVVLQPQMGQGWQKQMHRAKLMHDSTSNMQESVAELPINSSSNFSESSAFMTEACNVGESVGYTQEHCDRLRHRKHDQASVDSSTGINARPVAQSSPAVRTANSYLAEIRSGASMEHAISNGEGYILGSEGNEDGEEGGSRHVAADDGTRSTEHRDENADSPANAMTHSAAAERKVAARVRAQKLAAARFTGMKTAAEAKGASVTTAGDSDSRSVGEGVDSGASGDRRLRQDVSTLVARMTEQGMLSDRQRVFLLAQVGRRITEQARQIHARYLETGDSKTLYSVLMALSISSQQSPGKELGESDDNEDYDGEDESLGVSDEESGVMFELLGDDIDGESEEEEEEYTERAVECYKNMGNGAIQEQEEAVVLEQDSGVGAAKVDYSEVMKGMRRIQIGKKSDSGARWNGEVLKEHAIPNRPEDGVNEVENETGAIIASGEADVHAQEMDEHQGLD